MNCPRPYIACRATPELASAPIFVMSAAGQPVVTRTTSPVASAGSIITADLPLPYAGRYAHTVDSTQLHFFVLAPNDGANYWTVTVKEQGTGTDLHLFTTAAFSAGAWQTALIDHPYPAGLALSQKFVYVVVTKTGAPGAIGVVPNVIVRARFG
jgi:hypothetical protein